MASVDGLESKLQQALLALRLGVFTVMLVWTLDKFVNPAHAIGVFERFYLLAGLGEILLYAIAGAELVLIACFVAGLFKRWSYGLVLLLHAGSTLSAWQLYLDPFKHLLFFAAWPMLAACWALYLLRDADVLFTVKNS
jgi:putative oxidoreductase